MFRKLVFVSLLMWLLLLVSGCDSDFLTDKHRRQALNEAGAEYGLEFGEARGEIPDMPDGAVLIFDADERGKVVTEVFLEDSSMLVKLSNNNTYMGFSYFVLDEQRIAIFFSNMYRVYEEPYLLDMYRYTRIGTRKNLILLAKSFDIWTSEEAECFYDEYFKSVFVGKSEELGYALGKFLFDETHKPESPYYNVNEKTEEAVIDEIVYNSLQQTQLLEKISGYDFPIVPIGNRVDPTALSEDTWTVYCVPYRLDWENSREAMRRKKDVIIKDFLYLWNHHLSASDID